MTIEYLATPRTPTRWPQRWVATIVVLVVLVAGAFVWWSEQTRRAANETLASALAQADEGAEAGEARVLSTLAYSYPMIWSTLVPEEVRAGLREVVQASAVDVADGLRQVRGQVEGVRVLPWQGEQAKARDEVLAVIDAQLARFDQMGGDAAAIGVVMAVPAPSDAAARDSLRASGAELVSDR